MNGTEQEIVRSGRRRLASVALVAGGLLSGVILAGTQIASAQDSSSSSTPAVSAPAAGAMDPTTVRHGPGETLLTGDTAAPG